MIDPSGEYVQSLAKGLAVILAFDAARPRQSLSDIARTTDMSRASARRSLHTLAELGYVRTNRTQFWLAPKVLELGYGYLSGLTLPEVAQPHLQDLADTVRESTSVSVLDGPDIVYVARVAVKRIMSVSITIGTRFPAYATSMGRVLLAGMSDTELGSYLASTTLEPITRRSLSTPASLRDAIERVRRRGHAIVDQELEEGLRSVAAPIEGLKNTVVAAVNISTHVSRYTEADIRRDLLPPLRRAAQAISSDLQTVLAHRDQSQFPPVQAHNAPRTHATRQGADHDDRAQHCGG